MTAIKQIGGTHYEAPYQHWDMVDDLDLGYFEGQITKYVMRSRKKNGVQDIQKAQTFLERLVKRARRYGTQRGRVHHRPSEIKDILNLFFTHNDCTPQEKTLILMTVEWSTIGDLDILRRRLGDLLQTTLSAEPGAGYVNQDRDPQVDGMLPPPKPDVSRLISSGPNAGRVRREPEDLRGLIEISRAPVRLKNCRCCGNGRPDNGDRCPSCGDDPDGYLQGAR